MTMQILSDFQFLLHSCFLTVVIESIKSTANVRSNNSGEGGENLSRVPAKRLGMQRKQLRWLPTALCSSPE